MHRTLIDRASPHPSPAGAAEERVGASCQKNYISVLMKIYKASLYLNFIRTILDISNSTSLKNAVEKPD